MMTTQQKKTYAKMKNEQGRDEWFANLAEAIEGDSLPWQKPWKGGSRGLPSNLVSKKAYRGCNIAACWVAGMVNGWSDLRFGTRKQLMDKDYSIKGLKNGTGVGIMLWKPLEYTKENKNGELEVRQTAVTRWYEVWCVEQCENYVAPVCEAVEIVAESEMMQHFRDYIESQKGLTNSVGGSQASYNWKHDSIRMPPHESFTDPVGEVMTAMHEAAHSTGHKTRLGRVFDGNRADYAYEELIAEMTSLIVTLTLGGEFKPNLVAEENPNNVAYLQHWLTACRDKDKALMRAFSDAQKAADYIVGTLEVE